MSAIPSRETLVPGDKIADRYRIIEFLGRGGVGDVYRVEDLELGVEVALKRLRPEVARHKETLKRFRHEVVLARRLQGRSVARIFDLGLDDDTLFITMEYLPGPSLAILMAEHAPFPISEALSMGQQICQAVGEAHAIGIVHRDIKPQNILFDSTGRMKVTDFGMAYAPDVSGDTTSGSLLGTPQYMSPEQAEGLPVDPRSDVYAIGLILYELLTGVFPFSSHSPITSLVQRLRKRPVSMRTYTMEIPRKVDSLVDRCLERDVRKRPADARELGRLLRSCATHESSVMDGNEPRKRSISAAFIILIGLVSTVSVLLFGLPRKRDSLEGRTIVVTTSPSELQSGFARFLGTVLSTCVCSPVIVTEEEDFYAVSEAVELHVNVSEDRNRLYLKAAVISADTIDTYIASGASDGIIDPGELIRRCCFLFNPGKNREIEQVTWSTEVPVFKNLLKGLANDDTSHIRAAVTGGESWPWGHYFLTLSLLKDSPQQAKHSLKRAIQQNIPHSAALAIDYRIRSREGKSDDVIRDIFGGTFPSDMSFALRKASLEATIRSGYSAASTSIILHGLRTQSKIGIGSLLALRDLVRGNTTGALNWCEIVRRFDGSTPTCMIIEALTRLYLGEPERAAGISRELLQLEQSEEAYILLAEASIRQRELLNTYEITTEGLTRHRKSIYLRHLRNLVIQDVDQESEISPFDSSLVFTSDTVLDQLVWIMYAAPFRPAQCEKLWWGIVSHNARRPEVWLTGAWIARHLHDPAVTIQRLKRAVRFGIAEAAILQDIRFADMYVRQ